MAYELFVLPYGEGGVADVLIRTERLMFKQFEYEETAVLSGKQLCYSEYFKVLILIFSIKILFYYNIYALILFFYKL